VDDRLLRTTHPGTERKFKDHAGEGWLYLAAVQDTYSRLIVGWSRATHMRASLVVDALKMALARRR
jgi:transposase InsO family protein